DLVREKIPARSVKARQEAWFNHFAPFYRCAALYVLVFVLAVLSWMMAPQALLRSAFALLVFVFIVHTFGLSYRMYLQGRPPVVNL
ncbi:hypothetical protein NL529_30815, partial [Klebsiella pneumoniae]|nr:hypothetical protein [Klebsiella pneumoniae]